MLMNKKHALIRIQISDLFFAGEACYPVTPPMHVQKFPTAEKRAEILHGERYVSCPTTEEFGHSLLVKLGLSSSAKEFTEWRDTASCQSQLPLLSLKISGGELWPILIVEQYGYIFCCLPLVEEALDGEKKPPAFEMQSVSVGFSVLLGIMNFIGPAVPDETSSKFIELNNHLSYSMPFGCPSDVKFSNVEALFHLPDSDDETGSSAIKQPAWKPSDYKGKQRVTITITEYIRSSQCDKPGTKNALDVYGTIRMKAELEGFHTSITLTINNGSAAESQDCIVLHPCAQLVTSPIMPKEGVIALPPERKVRLSPPLHPFVLCHYTATHCKNPPISGMYKLRIEKADNTMELLLQLKLDECMQMTKTHLSFCEARMSFFQRDFIKHADLNLTCGSIQISEDRHTVIWNIGQKFSAKDLEASLSGKIIFQDKLPGTDSDSRDEKDLYAQLFFKQLNHTVSGCYIDPKRIHISPSSRAKIQIEQEVQAAEYKIWNSIGGVPFCLTPDN